MREGERAVKPLLAPLWGDASPVTVIGFVGKNAGKTTALCRAHPELEGETLAMTSVGGMGTDRRGDGDGKAGDLVTAGTLFATARGLLPLCDATVEVDRVMA